MWRCTWIIEPFCDNTTPEVSVMSGLTQNEMNGPAPARPSLCSKMIQPRGPSSQCQSVTPPLGPHLSNLFRNQRTKLRELRTSRISAVRELLDITNEYLTSTSFISKVNQRVGRPYIYLLWMSKFANFEILKHKNLQSLQRTSSSSC